MPNKFWVDSSVQDSHIGGLGRIDCAEMLIEDMLRTGGWMDEG